MRVFPHLEQEIAIESVSIENTVVNRRNHSLVKERICVGLPLYSIIWHWRTN